MQKDSGSQGKSDNIRQIRAGPYPPASIERGEPLVQQCQVLVADFADRERIG